MQTQIMTQAAQLLREHYGYDSFHSGQQALIEQVLAGRDVLGIMPTGAGKSVCYQIPAMLLPGITVVVSPLISLMKDQVDGLRRMGLPAALLNSSQTRAEAAETWSMLSHGEVKLLYIAPERLEAEGFAQYLSELQVSMVAVDEAHCVSQWGHDFRPSYRRIRALIDTFPTRPVVGAYTATATARVRQDILALLGLRQPHVLTAGFDRPNLFFAVQSPRDRDKFVLDYLRENGDSAGIVYCLTRKAVEKLAATLNRSGIAALPYHAGLPDDERRHAQDAFRDDKIRVIVATNAFGMGIDKSNVRFVLHYGMPRTLESYYQEAGRAGRDGQPADCILLFGAQDVVTNRFLIERQSETGEDAPAQDRTDEYRKLQDMVDYCSGDACLRAYILRYFGVEDVPDHCGACSCCNSDVEATDITVEAQKILSCVIRMGNRFGSLLVAQVLRGGDTQKIRQFGFEKLSTWGIMKEYSQKSIQELISFLVTRGYLEVRGGEFPVIVVGEKGTRFLREKQTLTIRRVIDTKEQRKSRAAHTEHAPLFEALRALRREIAAEQGVAPYLIFSDATLAELCSRLPWDADDMLQVSGVGKFKLEQYGDEFLFAIRQYMDENNIMAPVQSAAPKQKPAEEDAPSDTVAASWELYRQGRSLQEIAGERDLTVQTVENHLIKAHEQGMQVDLDAFIPQQHRQAILDAVALHGTERLRPIKDALPEEVGYTAIRFGIARYRSDLAKRQ